MFANITKDGEMCTLVDCPAGLFLYKGDCLGFKTEYSIELGQNEYYPQAFVVASGEVFWGDAKCHEERCKLMVQPITIETNKD